MRTRDFLALLSKRNLPIGVDPHWTQIDQPIEP